MAKYEQPELNKKSFTCVFCETLSEHTWNHRDISVQGYFYDSIVSDFNFRISISTCNCCKQKIIWKDENIIYPKSTTAPPAIEGMPDNIKTIYEEAARVVSDSPKSTCALLRLAIETLCNDIIPTGNLNNKIRKMVEMGLDIRVQKALDIVRITGNEKIHPGQIDDNDTIEIAKIMFDLVNFIVDRLIIQPKTIDDMFNNLPTEKRSK